MERTIVDFTAVDAGKATLTRAVPKADATTEGTIQWDIDLVSGVDEVQAGHMAGPMPNAMELYARARDGKASATVTIRPTARDIRLTLVGDDGDVLKDVRAEIRHLKMTLTEKAQVSVARLRLFGLTTEQSAGLLAYLGKPMGVASVPIQQSFDFATVEIGSVVTANDGINDLYGVLTQRHDDHLVIDDFGVLHTVTALNAVVVLADGWQDHAGTYQNAVDEVKGAPSWRYLMSALAEVGVDNTLDEAVTTKALEYHLPIEPVASTG